MIKQKYVDVENFTKVHLIIMIFGVTLILYYHRELFYRRKYWLMVSALALMILYEALTMHKVSFDDILICFLKRIHL